MTGPFDDFALCATTATSLSRRRLPVVNCLTDHACRARQHDFFAAYDRYS